MDKGLSLSEPQFPEQGNEDPPRARGGVRELIPNKCATNNVMADWMFPIATGLIMTWLFFLVAGTPHSMQDLSSQSWLKPVPPAVVARSLNHWMTRKP